MYFIKFGEKHKIDGQNLLHVAEDGSERIVGGYGVGKSSKEDWKAGWNGMGKTVSITEVRKYVEKHKAVKTLPGYIQLKNGRRIYPEWTPSDWSKFNISIDVRKLKK